MYCLCSDKDRSSTELLLKVRAYLFERGIACSDNPDKAEMIFAVGDDRFILSTFKDLGSKRIPVFGITPGVGVLTEANVQNYEDLIANIVKGDYRVLERARLVASYSGLETPFALNEIGIFPSRSAELMRYTLSIDDEDFFKDTADGVIVSTPTGSTGYAMSVGGPMVVDEPEIFTVTPVSSMDRAYSPLVVPNGSVIRISGIQAKSSVSLVIDGKDRIALVGDSLEISRSKYPALFVVTKNSQSIVDRLRKRAVEVNPEVIKDMPPSAKLVYKALVYEGEMTQKEIIAETYLPARTVRYAIDILLEKNMISLKPNLNDVRQTVYSV